MSLIPELWLPQIESTLSQSNKFLKFSKDHSSYVVMQNGVPVTVHVPNAGADTDIFKNNTNWPLTAAQRTDIDLTYAINSYSTQLIFVNDVENTQLSYNKVDDVIGSEMRTIADTLGNQACYAWAPSATTNGVTRIVRTTGPLSGTALASGATGNRQCLVLPDMISGKNKLDADLVPSEGRIALIPSAMMGQLISDPAVYQQSSYGSPVLPEGVVAKLMGFNIIERPNVVVYSATTNLIKTITDRGQVAASNTTDNLGAILYHPDFVAHAKSPTKLYYDANRSEYQGGTISARAFFGASKMRANGAGVVGIVQQ